MCILLFEQRPISPISTHTLMFYCFSRSNFCFHHCLELNTVLQSRSLVNRWLINISPIFGNILRELVKSNSSSQDNIRKKSNFLQIFMLFGMYHNYFYELVGTNSSFVLIWWLVSAACLPWLYAVSD